MIATNSPFAALRTVKGRQAFADRVYSLILSHGFQGAVQTSPDLGGKGLRVHASLTNEAGQRLTFATSINADYAPLGHWVAEQPRGAGLMGMQLHHEDGAVYLGRRPGTRLTGAFQAANGAYSGRQHHKATLYGDTPEGFLNDLDGALGLHRLGDAIVMDGPEPRTMRMPTATGEEARRIADATGDAYSAPRYSPGEWALSAQLLLDAGLTGMQAAWVLRSTWTRWAADASSFAGDDAPEAYATAGDLAQLLHQILRDGDLPTPRQAPARERNAERFPRMECVA